MFLLTQRKVTLRRLKALREHCSQVQQTELTELIVAISLLVLLLGSVPQSTQTWKNIDKSWFCKCYESLQESVGFKSRRSRALPWQLPFSHCLCVKVWHRSSLLALRLSPKRLPRKVCAVVHSTHFTYSRLQWDKSLTRPHKHNISWRLCLIRKTIKSDTDSRDGIGWRPVESVGFVPGRRSSLWWADRRPPCAVCGGSSAYTRPESCPGSHRRLHQHHTPPPGTEGWSKTYLQSSVHMRKRQGQTFAEKRHNSKQIECDHAYGAHCSQFSNDPKLDQNQKASDAPPPPKKKHVTAKSFKSPSSSRVSSSEGNRKPGSWSLIKR